MFYSRSCTRVTPVCFPPLQVSERVTSSRVNVTLGSSPLASLWSTTAIFCCDSTCPTMLSAVVSAWRKGGRGGLGGQGLREGWGGRA